MDLSTVAKTFFLSPQKPSSYHPRGCIEWGGPEYTWFFIHLESFIAGFALQRRTGHRIKLHGPKRTGLYTCATATETPLRLLNGHFFRKPLLDFIEVLRPLLGFQSRHLSPASRIVFLFLGLFHCLAFLIPTFSKVQASR